MPKEVGRADLVRILGVAVRRGQGIISQAMQGRRMVYSRSLRQQSLPVDCG